MRCLDFGICLSALVENPEKSVSTEKQWQLIWQTSWSLHSKRKDCFQNKSKIYWRSFYKTHEHYNSLIKIKWNDLQQIIKTKWNYVQKIIKGPASLIVARDRNVLCGALNWIQKLLMKIKDVFVILNIVPIMAWLGGNTTFSITTFSITTLSLMAFSIMDFIVTISIMTLIKSIKCHNTEFCYDECRIFFCYAECHYAGSHYIECHGTDEEYMWWYVMLVTVRK